MRKDITCEVLQYCLDNLSAQNALEFHLSADGMLRIPYLMNDVVECYIQLQNVTVTGTIKKNPGSGTSAESIRDGARYAVIVRTAEGEIFTIWYDNTAVLAVDCYQYHRIMHYWRKGAPHLRNQVGIISSLYDKRHYIGQFVCTEQEQNLSDLILFGPFRHYSPIRNSLDPFYPEHLDGARAMLRIAEKAGDREYARLIRDYMKRPSRLLKGILTLLLQLPQHDGIYQEIEKELTQSSSTYSCRHYEGKEGLSCEIKRRSAERMLETQGYSREYPCFRRGMTKITIYEEQPFTQMEDRPLGFRVLLLREQKRGFYTRRSVERVIYPGKMEDIVESMIQNAE